VILSRGKSLQKPNLDSYNLIRFLDKFAYRKSKATDGNRGVSIMQPIATHNTISRYTTATNSIALNSASFRNKATSDVAADDIFFHVYFKQLGKNAQNMENKVAPEKESDGMEDEIWEALNATHGQQLGEVMSESSDDMFDFDDSDMDTRSIVSEESELSETGDNVLEHRDNGGNVQNEEKSNQFSLEWQQNSDENPREKKRKRYRDMPTFASAEDYAELLSKEDDE
jgi:ribosome biogenesis protein MAK21